MSTSQQHFILDESYAYLGWIVLIVFSGGALFPLLRIIIYQDDYLAQFIFASLAVGLFIIASKSILELGRRRYRIHIFLEDQLRIQSYLGEQPLQELNVAFSDIRTIEIFPASERSASEAWFDLSYGYICILKLKQGEKLDLAAGTTKQLQFRIDELQRIAEAIQSNYPKIKLYSPMSRSNYYWEESSSSR